MAKVTADQLPKRGETINGPHGEKKCLGVIDGYVVWRHKGAIPGLMTVKDWIKLRSSTHTTPGPAGGG